MKGLLIKDFYVIKDGLLIPFLTMIALGIGLSVVGTTWILPVIAAATLSMQVALTIATDKASQWYKFSATLPISRAQFIASKYFMYFLFSIIGILFGAVIAIAASIIQGAFSMDALLANACLAVIMTLLPGSVNIPCSFLFSEEKGIAGLVISYVVTAGIYVGFRFLLGRFIDLEANMLLVHGIIAASSFVIYLLSCIICPKVLSNQEL